MKIEPRYSDGLNQDDMNTIVELVRRHGFAIVIGAVGDILTQSNQIRAKGSIDLSFCLGGAMAAARPVDREFPPSG